MAEKAKGIQTCMLEKALEGDLQAEVSYLEEIIEMAPAFTQAYLRLVSGLIGKHTCHYCCLSSMTSCKGTTHAVSPSPSG